jgi:hypothetical protein
MQFHTKFATPATAERRPARRIGTDLVIDMDRGNARRRNAQAAHQHMQQHRRIDAAAEAYNNGRTAGNLAAQNSADVFCKIVHQRENCRTAPQLMARQPFQRTSVSLNWP